jgi:predicted MFS family arabinose efflux permease
MIAPPSQLALLMACGIAAMGIVPLSSVRFPETPRINGRDYKKSGFLFRFLPAIGLWGLASGCVSPFATIYFSRHLNVPMPRLGLLFSISHIFQFLGILMAPFLFRKCGRMTGIVNAEFVVSVTLLGLAFVMRPMAAGAIYVVYTAAQWMSEPALYSMLMDNVPVHERSSAAGWNALVLSASQAIAAACAGAALVRFGYVAVLSAAAAIALAAACSFKLLLGGRRRVLHSLNELSATASTPVAP